MLYGTKFRGWVFCAAMFISSFVISNWIISGISPQAGANIAFWCGVSAALPSGLFWFTVMSSETESRLVGMGIGLVSASATFPVLGLIGMIIFVTENLQAGAKLNGQLIGDALVGGIGFTFFAALFGGLFAYPIAALLGFLIARNKPKKTSYPSTIPPHDL